VNLTPNQILANKYKLVRRLGEGGMGTVWIADHLHLERQVAIKVISNRVISDPTVRQRFETEARATAKVESPHVVQVLDFDYTEVGQPFLVLELLVGETLEQRLSREGVLSLGDARELMKQTTHALAEAHRAEILHRDIKADNLFLVARDDLFVKLLDFGICINRDRASHPDSAFDQTELSPIGTPLYMSPEQTLGLGTVDERSDLYSLAVCMYYALTGEFPFCADSLAVLAFAQQREDFTLPSVRRPELGAPLDAFFLRAFSFDPEDRFATAEKMCDAFERACERRSDVASNVPTLRHGPVKSLAASLRTEMKPRRRKSHKGLVLASAAALFAASFLLVPRSWLPSTPQAVTTTAAFIASRIPTAPVSAATEAPPNVTVDRYRSEARASLVSLPLPHAVAVAHAPAPVAPVTVSKPAVKKTVPATVVADSAAATSVSVPAAEAEPAPTVEVSASDLATPPTAEDPTNP
jgi:serine/threonine-protein kinase